LPQQVVTLIAAMVGAAVGLLAPFLSTRIGRADRERDAQRDVAARIMALFEDVDYVEGGFTSRHSVRRRQLYLLALRLTNTQAREATMRFIAAAGQYPAESDELFNSWEAMMSLIGGVYRQSPRAVRS
jgi:hypothetical protein